ncbi:hypothetical protein JB92DRAFT_2953350 [Gautieria morchelliformis]|nr:hypothetical protein JB92DRAFT_2953350 [Gautieria morchelliformis]
MPASSAMYPSFSDFRNTPVSSPSVKSSHSVHSSMLSPTSPYSGHLGVDEVSALRLETFAPYRERIRTAKMMLTWARSGERVYHWPCHLDNQLYADYELPDAFRSLHIEHPQCPCATQETDPEVNHPYEIWVVQSGRYKGKVAAACAQKYQACGSWFCLTDLIKENPDLPAEVYELRPEGDVGPGLPHFDRYGLLRLVHATPTSRSGISTSSPISPPPPYQFNRGRRGGFSGVTKTAKKDSGINKTLQRHPASVDDPFVVSPSRSTSPSTPGSSSFSLPNVSEAQSHSSLSMFTLPQLPLPSEAFFHSSDLPLSKGPIVPDSSRMPPSNQLAMTHGSISTRSHPQSPTMSDYSGSIPTTPRSRHNLHERVTIMPGDRMFGDTSCLWEPPDPHLVAVYNRHVPPLRGSELEDALAALRLNEGVNSATFWRMFDMCNCNQFFTKEVLHYVHGPQCPVWVYGNNPAI